MSLLGAVGVRAGGPWGSLLEAHGGQCWGARGGHCWGPWGSVLGAVGVSGSQCWGAVGVSAGGPWGSVRGGARGGHCRRGRCWCTRGQRLEVDSGVGRSEFGGHGAGGEGGWVAASAIISMFGIFLFPSWALKHGMSPFPHSDFEHQSQGCPLHRSFQEVALLGSAPPLPASRQSASSTSTLGPGGNAGFTHSV